MDTSLTEPDAIVFIPGIFQPWEGSVVEGLGERLSIALERNSPSRLRFGTSTTTNTFPDPFGVTEVVKVSVSPDEENESKSLADLYSLDLVGLLTESYRLAGTLKKAWHLGFHVITLAPRTALSFFRRDMSLRGKAQVMLCGAVTLLMQLSFLILIATLVAGFASLTQASDELGWLHNFVNWALPFAGVILAAVALVPRKIRSALDSFTVFILSFIGYLSASIGRDAAVGTYEVGTSPNGICFDGQNIWVTNCYGNSVTKQ